MKYDPKKTDRYEPDKSSILAIDFHYDAKVESKNLNMFVSTKEGIYIFKGGEKKPTLHQSGTNLMTVSAKGQLYAVNAKDFKIFQFNQLGKTGKIIDFANEKLLLRCIGNNQVIIVITKKNTRLSYIYIFDTLNQYISDYYQYRSVLHIINSPRKLILLTENNN